MTVFIRKCPKCNTTAVLRRSKYGARVVCHGCGQGSPRHTNPGRAVRDWNEGKRE